MRVLVVTADGSLRHELAHTFEPMSVDLCSDFRSARAKLAAGAYDLIVTEMRLGEFNGLHLAYIAKHDQPQARTVVFTAPFDPALASETIAAGAFYEHTQRIVATARGYLGAVTENHPRAADDVDGGFDQLLSH
jgi:DNA-binding NtrC family response regulator